MPLLSDYRMRALAGAAIEKRRPRQDIGDARDKPKSGMAWEGEIKKSNAVRGIEVARKAETHLCYAWKLFRLVRLIRPLKSHF